MSLVWITWVLFLVCMLMAVAFVTLLERKILGMSQIRVGPNKVSIMGLFQPVLDGLKLLTKPWLVIIHIRRLMHWASPGMMLLIAFCWLQSMSFDSNVQSSWQVLWLLLLFALGTYTLLIGGWGASSKYSVLGGGRALAQALGYESVLVVLVLAVFLPAHMLVWNVEMGVALSWMWSLVWFTCLLAETQRAPFDLAEGESELAAGYITEFSGALFTLVSLAEYAILLVLASWSSYMWMGWGGFMLIWVSAWLWVRACWPRVRYDNLMSILWGGFLPLSLVCLWFVTSVV